MWAQQKSLLGLAEIRLIAYLTLAAKVPSLATYPAPHTLDFVARLRPHHKNLQILVGLANIKFVIGEPSLSLCLFVTEKE